MLKLVKFEKVVQQSNASLETSVKIPLTTRNLNRNRTKTIKILADSIAFRSLSSKQLSLHSKPSIEKLKSNPTTFSILPKLQKLISFQKPSPKELRLAADLLKTLPVKLNYPVKTLNLLKPFGCENKKTLILDLDETLTHTVKSNQECHLKLWVNDNVQICVNVRPYVQDLLKFASQFFEVVVFTASQQKYANTILDYLDPCKKLIHHRVYRENCVSFQGCFIKDLRIFSERNMKDMIIVDNSMISYALQIENGVPIAKWTDDLRDNQMKKLIDYLQVAKNTYDIRVLNRDIFNLKALISEIIRSLQ